MRLGSWLLCVSIALAACGRGGIPAASVVRDSAGVRIVENAAFREDNAESWRLPEGPAVEIGGLEVGENYELFRVTGALRLSDGRIAIANGGTHQIRFYDGDGVYVSTTGREGGGPGEFRGLSSIRNLPSDTIITYDTRLNRLSLFDNTGGFASSFSLEQIEGVPIARVASVFDDGSFLARATDPADRPLSGLLRIDNQLHHYSATGQHITHMGTFSGDARFIQMSDRSVNIFVPPLGHTTRYRTAGSEIYVAPSDTYEVRAYDLDGALKRIVRLEQDPIDVTNALVDAVREEWIGNTRSEEAARGLRAALNEMPQPTTIPAYSMVFVDDALNLWIREFRLPGEDGEAWHVFDSAGYLIARAAIPAGLEPMHIGDDFFLGRWRDDLDVEYVRIYELVKS